MRISYWKRESIVDGSLIALFKVERTDSEILGFIYKDGGWVEHPHIAADAGWSDDYDCISEEEANNIIAELGGE